MKRSIINFVSLIIVITALGIPEGLAGQRRRVVVRGPVVRTRVFVHPGHPIRRVLPPAVVVRAARRPVVVGAPLVYLPALAWAPAVAPMPAGERLVWQ